MLRDVLRAGLAEAGYSVVEAVDVVGVLDALERQPISLVALDVELAGPHGFEFVPQIRARRTIPVVIITGRDSPHDRLAGLEHGADEYITKPVLVAEVLIRVRRVLQRYALAKGADAPKRAARPTTTLHFDHARLDLRRRCVRLRGGEVPLTEAEFKVLRLLLKHRGRVISRDEISMALKGRAWSPLDRSIDGHVARLRRKLGESIRHDRLIRSVRTIGYVYVGDAADWDEDEERTAGSFPSLAKP